MSPPDEAHEAHEEPPQGPARRSRPQRKQVLLRLDPLVYDALARWAGDDLRSANQIEFLLRRALAEAGRLRRSRRRRPCPGRAPCAPRR
ncbi:hypothetical protein ABZT43_49475 [Streptomyces sp. NPDC005349]|uniref:hypothetical protein n=1 Tax=Streptomyces sp. NPDC005349 TaxID=3157037 RepID=UPI0033B06037